MPNKQVYIAIIGVGGVGAHFLSQLSSLPNPPTLILLARSTKTLFTPDYTAIPLSWESALESSAQQRQPPLTLPEIQSYLSSAPGPTILVDNTSDQSVADSYPSFLRSGISIVTPNKKAFSGSLELWDAIFAAAASPSPPSSAGDGNGAARGGEGGGMVYHESSVGAGLPIISTLKDLIATGDQVTRIEGVFSGTMSFLFNQFAPAEAASASDDPSSQDRRRWSEEVQRAKELGFTEPDPRDDLNGLDVARKLTILARLAGLRVAAPTAFPVQSLIPKDLESCRSGDEFLERLPEFDGEMEEVKREAERFGKVVRFVGVVDMDVARNKGAEDGGGVKVGLEMFDQSSAIAGLKGSANMISFHTKRYPSPLIIQGAGAGGEVTAMGVTGDLIKVLERLRGR